MFGKSKQRISLVTGLDIGSTAIRVVAGQVKSGPDDAPTIQIVGAAEVPSGGVSKGIVNSIEETVSALSHALEQIERQIGVPIDHAWVGITGAQVISHESKGVVAVARSDGEIAEEDIERAVEAARIMAPPLNYEVLHVIPRHYTVDGQTGIKDPVGMTGVRLEVDTQIIYGVTAHIKNITKAVYRTGIDIDDLVLSILAIGDVVTTPRQKELGVAVVSIGGSTTSLAVYEEGDLLHVAVLPLGSEHITNDLAIGLRTSIDIAERVKIDFGHCVPTDFAKKDTIRLSEAGMPEEEEEVSRRYIAEIVAARVSEILEKVNKEFKKVSRSGLLPAGVVFTGAGAKIVGLVELAKEELRLPASLGYVVDIQSISDKVHDLGFAAAIGLVKWGAHMQPGMRRSRRRVIPFGAGRLVEQVQKVLKSLIP